MEVISLFPLVYLATDECFELNRFLNKLHACRVTSYFGMYKCCDIYVKDYTVI